MTTAQAIEGITDAGKFEILATRVLRLVDSDCNILNHLGVNAEGKTIKGPVDGFCKVPGSDPTRFVMAAFATDTADKLERKWIFDHSIAKTAKKSKPADDGDLIKAGRCADSLRGSYPDVSFVVWLCTNKQPNDKVMVAVLQKGKELGIEVKFLGQSILRDTLDTTPEGQWLRKEHLGISAERLSFSLLRELAYRSLDQYSREFLITPPESFIETKSERSLVAALEEQRSVYVVSGPSGNGKSATCFQVLKRHLSVGDLGIWISGKVAAESNSLEEAIGSTLRSLYPSIEESAGNDALQIAKRSRHLVLIIDDIARGGNPPETLRKILSWRAPVEQGNSQRPAHSIIVPIWDLFWAPLEDQLRSASWIARLPLSRMDEDEACACLAAALGDRSELVHESERKRVVSALAFDPILIALYAVSVFEDDRIGNPLVAIELIGNFISTSSAEAAASSSYNAVDFQSALAKLSAWMLTRRKLYPEWETLNDELPENVVKILNILAHRSKICRVTPLEQGGQFEFRHDRLLNYIFAQGLKHMTKDLEKNCEIVSDPYFADYLGSVLVIETPAQELIDWVEKRAPLALLTALQYFPEASNEVSFAIVDAATRWVQHAFRNDAAQPAILHEISRVLEQTDSPYILQITKDILGDRLIARARLANGCSVGILAEFSDAHWFSPGVTDRALDAVLHRGMRRYREVLIEQCARFLLSESVDDDLKSGALILAGFLGESSLADLIQVAWSAIKKKEDAILPAVWAELRCPSPERDDDVGLILEAWAKLPDEDRGGGLSERLEVGSSLDFAIRRGIPSDSIDRLIRVAQNREELRWPITVALKHSDAPQAVVFLLQVAAKIQARTKESGGFSIFISGLKQDWNPSSKSGGRRLPPVTIQAIRDCWESDSSSDELREVAFELWTTALDDLEQLQTVTADHPNFRTIVWRRALLGDATVAPQFALFLKSDSHWFHIAQNIWSPPVKEQTEAALAELASKTPCDYDGGRANEHYALAEMLRDIPSSDAEPLLLKYWSGLRFSPLFIHLALYIGSPVCIEAAKEAIASYPSKIDVFKHIDSFFVFFTSALVDRVKQRHLDVLCPFISRLGDHTLSSMAEYCRRHGRNEWARRYLMPEFEKRKHEEPSSEDPGKNYIERMTRQHFPSDDDLLEELDKMIEHSRHLTWEAHRWSEEFEKRGDDHSRWRRLLETWLCIDVSVSRLQVVSAAILSHGTREDLGIIEDISIDGCASTVSDILQNVSFGVKRRSIC